MSTHQGNKESSGRLRAFGMIEALWKTGWRHKTPKSINADLTSLAASLADLNGVADSEFLKLGNDLKALDAAATSLATVIGDRANALRESLRQSHLTGNDGLAANSLRELEQEFNDGSKNLASLSEMAGALGQLNNYGGEMARIASLLQVSGSSFAIESVRTAECREAFSTFIIELRDLAGRVAHLGESISSQAWSARQGLDELIPTIGSQLTRLRQVTRQSETAVHESSEDMQQLLDSSQATLERAAAHTKRIAGHAEDAAYCLQFGDIVRQKLEHVVASVEEAATLFSPARKPAESEAGDPTDRAGHILAIQAGQLEVIRGEVQSACRQLTTAFSGVANESGQLAESLRELETGGQVHSADGTSFERLKTSLLRLRDLEKEGSGILRQADTSSRGAIEAASRLSVHLQQVQEINQLMQLQALNALIKTERLGRAGQTLGILSMHVHTVFQESSDSVAQTVTALERVQAHSVLGGDESSGDTIADSGLEAGLELLEQMHSSLHDAAASAIALTENQNEKFMLARSRIESLSALGDRITAMLEQCLSIRDALATTRRGGLKSPVLHSDRYTMESERQIHQRLSAELGGHAPSPAASARLAMEDPQPDGAANPDDNVELF